MPYAIYGTGGFAREVAPLLERMWEHYASSVEEVEPDIVHVDDAIDAPQDCNGRKVIDFAALVSDHHRNRKVIVAIGNGRTRESIEARCVEAGLSIGTAVHPSAEIMEHVEMAAGAVICASSIITSNIKIGRSFQSNLFSYIGHDCVIGNYVTFAPRVSCNGNVHIGDHAYIGTGAMIIQGDKSEPMTIGEGAIVGMGSVVTKPVDPYTLVAGNPARIVRTLTRPGEAQ